MKKIYLLILSFFIAVIPAFANDITILHTSDVHGRIAPIEYKGLKDVGGASRQSSFYKKAKLQDKRTLVLDSGDIFQGSIYYQMYDGKLTAELLKTLKYDAIALGNHEFDRGVKDLKKLIKKSHTTFLSANLEFSDCEMKKLVKPFIIKEVGGEKVLIIGVTTPNLKNLASTDGVTIYDPVSMVKKIIYENKADVIIVLSHCGVDLDKIIAKENPSINIILGGHYHLLFNKPLTVNTVDIVNSGEFGVYISKVIFSSNEGVKSFENVLVNNDLGSDEKIAKKLKKVDKKLNKLKQNVLATTKLTFIGEQTKIEHNQTNLGKLVLKSMVGCHKYDVVLTNSGSIRINKDFTGNITLADAMEILPFENKVVKGEIQGKDLKQILEYGKLYGRRYLQVYSKIKAIDDNKYYTVITNEYVAKGKDGFENFKTMKNITPIYESQKEALLNFLKRNPVITDETLKM